MPIKQIKVWECSDGTLHRTEVHATLQEATIDRNHKIGVWVGRYLKSGMSTGAIAKALMEYGDELGI